MKHALSVLTALLVLVGCGEELDTSDEEAPAAAEQPAEVPTEAAAQSTPTTVSPARSAAPQETEVTSIPAPFDVGAPPSNATTTASGLAYRVLQAGDGGEHPTADSTVEVHYTGWTLDGKMFDSSVVRGETISFPLRGVIAGWTEGVQLMTKGEKSRFWLPAALAYGETPRRPGAPARLLVFDIELIGIKNPPKTPADVAAAPSDASKTASGLAYKVLQPGTGTTHPGPTSQVTVHYSGWTKDGRMFDSSVMRGETITFGLNQVIPGWTEGVQLMVEGEKTRFWIPADLAYGEVPRRPGAPAGMLVFDIELFGIK